MKKDTHIHAHALRILYILFPVPRLPRPSTSPVDLSSLFYYTDDVPHSQAPGSVRLGKRHRNKISGTPEEDTEHWTSTQFLRPAALLRVRVVRSARSRKRQHKLNNLSVSWVQWSKGGPRNMKRVKIIIIIKGTGNINAAGG